MLFLATAGIAQVPWDEVPDLTKVELPVLAEANNHPEVLWSFLIDPATPYEQALAAASRCGGVLPLRMVEPLLRARAELLREDQAHSFGMTRPKYWSGPPTSAVVVDRERRILGRAWMVPRPRVPYPTTWAAACEAPWPWRTAQVLERAWEAIVRWIGAPNTVDAQATREWQERSQQWYAECLRWRIDDDDSAAVFFEASSVPAHGKSLRVLARWRSILLHSRTPKTATKIAHALGGAHRLLLYGEPDARLACEVLVGDGVRSSPHLQARWGCAYQLGRFRTINDVRMGEAHVPCPPEALLTVGDLAAAPSPPNENEAWNQLYVYAFSVCDGDDLRPFRAERTDQQDVSGLLTRFSEWWANSPLKKVDSDQPLSAPRT